jgi:hypothetical protein
VKSVPPILVVNVLLSGPVFGEQGDGVEDVFEVREAKKEAGSIRTSLFFSLYV